LKFSFSGPPPDPMESFLLNHAWPFDEGVLFLFPKLLETLPPSKSPVPSLGLPVPFELFFFSKFSTPPRDGAGFNFLPSQVKGNGCIFVFLFAGYFLFLGLKTFSRMRRHVCLWTRFLLMSDASCSRPVFSSFSLFFLSLLV